MKYCNLSYLLAHLDFGDTIYFKNGDVYTVEQVHDRYLIDLYDEVADLHTFDLRKLFLFEKIEKINEETLPMFNKKVLLDNNYHIDEDKVKHVINDNDKLWLPISFQQGYEAIKDGKVYASLFEIASKAMLLNEVKWHRAHLKKIYLKAKSETYNMFYDLYQDDVMLLLLNKDLLKDNDNILFNKDDEMLIFKYIDLSYIDKIYFTKQIAVDKFFAKIRHLEFSNEIIAKCVVDPYLLDESLLGKW